MTTVLRLLFKESDCAVEKMLFSVSQLLPVRKKKHPSDQQLALDCRSFDSRMLLADA